MTLAEFNTFVKDNPGVLAYISTTECNVCKSLRPKVEELIRVNYPKMKFIYIESNQSPEIAGQLSVFAVPTLLVFFYGKESVRKSRYIGIRELSDSIRRSYDIIFSQ